MRTKSHSRRKNPRGFSRGPCTPSPRFIYSHDIIPSCALLELLDSKPSYPKARALLRQCAVNGKLRTLLASMEGRGGPRPAGCSPGVLRPPGGPYMGPIGIL